MNERIKELATRATRQYSPTYYTQEWIQGFAQLIISECAEIALVDGQSSGNFDTFNKIQKHFGVSV